MAEHAVVELGALDRGHVLAPERYDPRRRPRAGDGLTIADCAAVVSEQVRPSGTDPDTLYLVLDTSDARDGIVLADRAPSPGGGLRSGKKRVSPGDVIVSRLRPYLRQVAYVDKALAPDGIEVLCSTEFYVLRATSRASIAFLVPVLLAREAQAVLAASQEGGHHPRFNLAALLGIAIPAGVAHARDSLSQSVERAVAEARSAEVSMRRLVGEIDGRAA